MKTENTSLPNLKATNRGSAKGIGIDFTPDGAKTLSLERRSGHLRITDISVFNYGDGAADCAIVLPSALKAHIRETDVRLAGVSLASLASNEMIHNIPNTLPDTALENFVQVQVRSLGSLAEEHFIYDYQVMRSLHPDQKNVLVSIVREEAVADCCNFLSGIKQLKSQKVTSHVLAVATAFCALHPDAAYLSTPQVVLDLEEDSTVMTIVCNGSIISTGVLLFGIHNIPHETGLQLLREEYENAVSRWRENLSPEDMSIPLKNIWLTGDPASLPQFFDMFCEFEQDATIQMFGIPEDMMPEQNSEPQSDLLVLFGLALLALDESPIKISLLPERQKWLEHKNREYPYLALAFTLLLIGVSAWLIGSFYYLNSALRNAEAKDRELQKCTDLIPQMERLHEQMAYQQKRMLPIAETGHRTECYMEALQRWQAAQDTGDMDERCWGIYLSDEFSFERANREQKEEEVAKPPTIRTPSVFTDLFAEETKPQEPAPPTYMLKTTNVNNLPVLGKIYIGGIAPLGKSRYKVVKDMQTQLVESNVYVNVDDHTDFIKENFKKTYFTPWQDFLQANKEALGGEFTTFFMQLPFRDEFIKASLLTPRLTSKRN